MSMFTIVQLKAPTTASKGSTVTITVAVSNNQNVPNNCLVQIYDQYGKYYTSKYSWIPGGTTEILTLSFTFPGGTRTFEVRACDSSGVIWDSKTFTISETPSIPQPSPEEGGNPKLVFLTADVLPPTTGRNTIRVTVKVRNDGAGGYIWMKLYGNGILKETKRYFYSGETNWLYVDLPSNAPTGTYTFDIGYDNVRVKSGSVTISKPNTEVISEPNEPDIPPPEPPPSGTSWWDLISWAEKIPVVGEWISILVKKIRDAVAGTVSSATQGIATLKKWYDSVKYYVNKLVEDPRGFIDRYLPWWIKDKFRELEFSLNSLRFNTEWNINRLRFSIETIKSTVWNYVPQFIKDKITNAYNWAREAYYWITFHGNTIKNWFYSRYTWFKEQLNLHTFIIWDTIKPRVEWLVRSTYGFVDSLKEFAEDPVGYIKKITEPLIEEFYKLIRPTIDEIKRRVDNGWKAIENLEKSIKYGFASFLLQFVAWFFVSFFRDLAELEYDPETGEVYGTPENPFSYVVIELIKVEKPKPPLGDES